MKAERIVFRISEEAAAVLRGIPVFPKEITAKKLATNVGISGGKIGMTIRSLPSYFPLAEENHGGSVAYCYPNEMAKDFVLERLGAV